MSSPIDIQLPGEAPLAMLNLLVDAAAAGAHSIGPSGERGSSVTEAISTAFLGTAAAEKKRKKRKKGLKGFVQKVAGAASDLLKAADPVSWIEKAARPLFDSIPILGPLLRGYSTAGFLSSGLLSEIRRFLDQVREGGYSLRSFLAAIGDSLRRAMLAVSVAG